jgi:magnesium transporter
MFNTEQRPKIEDFETCIYIVLKMLFYDERTNEINSEQVSIIFGQNFVISF